jgi:flagellar hook-associated protein 2
MTTSISAWYPYSLSPYAGSNTLLSSLSGSGNALGSPSGWTVTPPTPSYQTEISDLAGLQSNFESLLTQTQSLATLQSSFAFSTSSSTSSVATASASGGALSGTYNVQVSHLAQGQVLTSSTQSSASTAIGSGTPTTLTFQFANGSSQSVSIGSTNNTLQGISDVINSAQIGVSASVVCNGSGDQLAITGATGSANAFSVSASGDATLASMFSYSAGSGSNGLTLSASAQDAQGSVNGVAFSSGSNDVTGTANGVTLNLTGTGSTTVTVSPDATAATSTVQSFVNAYNAAQSAVNTLNNGDLAGTGVLAPIQDALTSVVNTATGSSNGLSSIGITANADGTLSFDAGAFQSAATANPQNVTQLLSNNSQTGFGYQLSTVLNAAVEPGGSIQSIMDGLQTQASVEQMLQGGLSGNDPTSSLGSSLNGLPGLYGASLYAEVQQLMPGLYPGSGGLTGSASDPLWSTMGNLSDAYSLLNNVYA